MAYITLPEERPGIRGLMAFRPDTALPLNQLAEILLRDENTLSRGDRELIATCVSHLNDCFFCQNAHGGIAQHYLQCDMQYLDAIKADYEAMPISEKMKALLQVAGSVTRGGKNVTPDQIERAQAAGATDMELHDTVMIAAFFCFCNRYVDGLGTDCPQDRQFYVDRGPMRAEEGYAHFDVRR